MYFEKIQICRQTSQSGSTASSLNSLGFLESETTQLQYQMEQINLEENSIEDRINTWLDNKNIMIINPDIKKHEYYNNIRLNLAVGNSTPKNCSSQGNLESPKTSNFSLSLSGVSQRRKQSSLLQRRKKSSMNETMVGISSFTTLQQQIQNNNTNKQVSN